VTDLQRWVTAGQFRGYISSRIATDNEEDRKMTKIAAKRPPATSQSAPLRIDSVAAPGSPGGRIGMTICPGKKDFESIRTSEGWDRDLNLDLEIIQHWGASALVTLIEDHEFEMLHVKGLREASNALGIDWIHLPIVDQQPPDERFLSDWPQAGPDIHRRLNAGQCIVIHCRGGIGRTGVVAAQILVERGMDPAKAITLVRACRRGAIETEAQEDYVLQLRSPSASISPSLRSI